VQSADVIKESTDLRFPHMWFPRARLMKRRIIFHAGPTNSGKTFHALAALRESHTGVYAGPLRLLALEVYESLNTSGIYANLMTGQERKLMPFGTHTSSTIEMLNLDVPVDCAVIDEIQMIADPNRGAAWTRAVLGVLAHEIHVCGDPATEEVLRALCAITGDEFVVRRSAGIASVEFSSTRCECVRLFLRLLLVLRSLLGDAFSAFSFHRSCRCTHTSV
jgi:ATP-dependent RNA helicase SUPV3L1/SUV3